MAASIPSLADGRTGKALQDAPVGSFFVCGRDDVMDCVADLARSLGRTDLALLGPTRVMDTCRGHRREIVVDHAANLDPMTIATIEFHNDRVREIAAAHA